MTEEEYEQARDEILALSRQWAERLGLNAWGVTDHFYRDEADFMRENDEVRSSAFNRSRWEYMEADLYWNVAGMFRQRDDYPYESIVVHEYAHTLVCEMRGPDGVTPHEERVATMIANALLKTHDFGRMKGMTEALLSKRDESTEITYQPPSDEKTQIISVSPSAWALQH